MNDLAQNLPLPLVRKPIHNPKANDNRNLDQPQNGQLSVSTEKTENEEEKDDKEQFCQVQVKRIRYLNPMKYYVTQDGYTFPTTSEENLGPIHLLNLSNKVQQISYDKGTGALTYSLTPRFDASDIVPWKYLLQKLKFGGYADYHDLMVSFEKLMIAREEWCNLIKTDPEARKAFTLEEFKLSSTVPQLAEVREIKHNDLPSFPVSKYIANKPMQKLLGISAESDVIKSLHLGVKYLKFLTKYDSIKFLQRYFENYTNYIHTNFENASKSSDLIKITRFAGDGTPLDLEISCKMMQQEKHRCLIYTYRVLDKKGNQYYFGNDSKKPGEPLTKPELYTEDQLQILNKEKQAALYFLKRFNYKSKYLYVDPPKDKVCRIKELSQKQDIKEEVA